MASRHFGCGRCGSRATRGRVEVARGLKKPFIFVTNDGQRAQRHHKKARHARARPAGARAGGPGRSSVERAASTGADGRVAGLRPGGSYRPVPALQRRPRGSSRGRVRTRTKRGRVRPGSASWTPRWLVPPGTTILTSAAWGRHSHSAFRRAGAAAEPNGHRREHADTMLKHHRVRYYPECVDLNETYRR